MFNLLKHKNVSLWAIPEGEEMQQKEVIMRIKGPYDEFAMYETALLGMLASASGWATAARACKEASGSCPVFCFGARHVHPAVAPVMERASIIGGADNCSCILGAKLLEKEPVGTVPHAAVMIIGDTVETALLYDGTMPPDSPRIMLVDTFKDEAEETLRVAEALKEKLSGVRLDTPRERGGVTPELVAVRPPDQKVFICANLVLGHYGERIPQLIEAGQMLWGRQLHLCRSSIDMTMDLKEIDAGR